MTTPPELASEYDLVIKGGTVVSDTSVYDADVAITGERIAVIGRDLRGRREIDAAGLYVIPGAIDVHVHLQMPIGRYTSTDDFYHGTRAAALGGTTAIVDFVETQPEERMLDALAARQALADEKVAIDYGLHMTIGPGDIAKLDQVPDVRAAGCGSFKLYMAYGLRLTDGELLQVLEAARDVEALPVVHAENWDVITTLIRRNLAVATPAPAGTRAAARPSWKRRPRGGSSTSPRGLACPSTYSTSRARPLPAASPRPRREGFP